MLRPPPSGTASDEHGDPDSGGVRGVSSALEEFELEKREDRERDSQYGRVYTNRCWRYCRGREEEEEDKDDGCGEEEEEDGCGEGEEEPGVEETHLVLSGSDLTSAFEEEESVWRD